MAGRLAVAHALPAALTGDLKRLGFTDYEARIYVQLLRQSPATAYETSKGAGVPRPNTYHALEALAQRGAVLPVSETPVRYVATSPRDLFETIARQTQSVCASLVDRLSALAPPTDDQYVWTLRGEAAVHDKIDTLIAECRETVWIKGGGRRAAPAQGRDPDGGRARRRRADRPLRPADADEFRFSANCRVYIHEGNGVRMGTADNLFTVAVDHAEMLTAAMDDEVIAATTHNRPIVNLAESLVRHDYYMAEIFARFGPEIEAAFGPYLRDLRLACLLARADRLVPEAHRAPRLNRAAGLYAPVPRAARRRSRCPTWASASAIGAISSNTGTPIARALSR